MNNHGRLGINNITCCINNIVYRSTVLYIRTNLRAMSVSVIGSH